MKKLFKIKRILLLFTLISLFFINVSSKEALVDSITVNFRVFDTSNGAVYSVGSKKVITDGTNYIQQEFTIPYLNTLTNPDYYNRVEKVTGNWYFPNRDCFEGETVELSKNSNTSTITYYVDSYKPNIDLGSNNKESIDIGTGGRYSWSETIVYHSNYPDGTDYTYTINYRITSYTSMYNSFGLIKSLESVGFSTPNGYLKQDSIWNTKQDGSGNSYKDGATFVFYNSNSNKTTHLYAQYKRESTDEELPTQVTLTYKDRSKIYSERNYFKGDLVIIIDNAEENKGYTFLGWDTDEKATNVVYKKADTFEISKDEILYAVWEKDETNYIVEWYDIEGNLLREAETRKGILGEKVSVTEDDKIIEGYTFEETYEKNILEDTLKEENTILRLYFSKNKEHIENKNPETQDNIFLIFTISITSLVIITFLKYKKVIKE